MQSAPGYRASSATSRARAESSIRRTPGWVPTPATRPIDTRAETCPRARRSASGARSGASPRRRCRHSCASSISDGGERRRGECASSRCTRCRASAARARGSRAGRPNRPRRTRTSAGRAPNDAASSGTYARSPRITWRSEYAATNATSGAAGHHHLGMRWRALVAEGMPESPPIGVDTVRATRARTYYPHRARSR